jgi:rhodanese-related sulfurtransferase
MRPWIVEFFVFVSEQWMLVSVLMVIVYLFAINERIKSGKPISSHVATRMLNSDEAVLLDIREAKDFKAGHIAGAINIPHTKLQDRLVELEAHREKAIIIADKAGQHTGAIGRRLQQKEFNVQRLTGGMMEWQNQKLPVVKG